MAPIRAALKPHALVVVVSWVVLLAAGAAWAGHRQPDYHGPESKCINGKYLHWNNPSKRYEIHTAGFPSGFTSRIDDAAAQWNGVGSSFTLTRDSGVAQDIRMMAVDGPANILAYTSLSYSCSTRAILSADITFDSGEDWYTGTGDAGNGIVGCFPVDCPVDAWSVATHEFGHFGGLGHYYLHDHDALCPDDTSHHTMCRALDRGTERDRTPAQYDRAAIQAIY